MKGWFFTAFLLLYGQQFLSAGEGYADLVSRLQNSVVHIQTTVEVEERRSPFFDPFGFFNDENQEPRRRMQRGAGSGFIISADGYIVTNRHVVADSKTVKVLLLDGRELEAEVMGVDDSLDVAVLKIESGNLPHFEIGNSDELRIGDILLAMGYPLQLGFSVTQGIVSGIGRNLQTGTMDLATYIQTDADITFGNSGGPLINIKGEVVGINTMIISRGETFGFAIPSNLFMHSVNQLRTYGRVKRGALGIQVSDLSPEAREYYKIDHGALVARVYEDFPAFEAGLQRDDVILEVDGKKVAGGDDVVSAVATKSPGDEITLRLLSEGRESVKKVKLADRSEMSGESVSARPSDESSLEQSSLGMTLVPLNRRARSELGLSRNQQGMLIHEVAYDSMAVEKGIRPGSVLTHVNRVPINSIADVREALQPIQSGDPVPVRVLEINPVTNVSSQRTVFLRKQ